MSIVNVVKNVALDPLKTTSSVEPTAAKGDDCVFFTEEFVVRLSTNGGSTFESFPWSDPQSVFPGASSDFFGDQSTIWVPRTKRFLWAMLHGPTRDSMSQIRLAFTSSAELKSTKVRFWTWLDIDPSQLGVTGDFEYPQLAVGENFLYITAQLWSDDLQNYSGAVWIRIALSDLEAMNEHSVAFQYFVSKTTANFGMAQRCGSRAYWASHEWKTNLLRLYFIDESSNSISYEDVGIPEWNNQDYRSLTPDGHNWLTDAWGAITGTFFAPDTLIFGWTAGRDNKASRPHPYIYLIQISQNLKSNKVKVVGIHHVWNRDHAWAFPGLSSVPSAGRGGPLAMSCGWGGGDRYFANHAVGFIDLPVRGPSPYTNETVSKSTVGEEGWGDFITVGNDEFEPLFLTAGYEIQKSKEYPFGIQSVSHYVAFSAI